MYENFAQSNTLFVIAVHNTPFLLFIYIYILWHRLEKGVYDRERFFVRKFSGLESDFLNNPYSVE